MGLLPILKVSSDLEHAGLIWQPEIGDEVSDRKKTNLISILVDPQGMTPNELRSTYLWLPTVEQMVQQFEARQAILFHAGLELNEKEICYKTVVKAHCGPIESTAESLRLAIAKALRELLIFDIQGTPVH